MSFCSSQSGCTSYLGYSVYKKSVGIQLRICFIVMSLQCDSVTALHRILLDIAMFIKTLATAIFSLSLCIINICW